MPCYAFVKDIHPPASDDPPPPPILPPFPPDLLMQFPPFVILFILHAHSCKQYIPPVFGKSSHALTCVQTNKPKKRRKIDFNPLIQGLTKSVFVLQASAARALLHIVVVLLVVDMVATDIGMHTTGSNPRRV